MVVEHDADRDLVVLAHRDALGPRDAEPEERNRLADEKDEAAHCKGCEPPRGAQRALGHAGEAREVALAGAVALPGVAAAALGELGDRKGNEDEDVRHDDDDVERERVVVQQPAWVVGWKGLSQ